MQPHQYYSQQDYNWSVDPRNNGIYHAQAVGYDYRNCNIQPGPPPPVYKPEQLQCSPAPPTHQPPIDPALLFPASNVQEMGHRHLQLPTRLRSSNPPAKPGSTTTRVSKPIRRCGRVRVPPLQILCDAAFKRGQLDEFDRLLVELREIKGLSWLSCKQEFKNLGRDIQVPALQMRFTRLKDRFSTWDPEDLHKLEIAKELVEARISRGRNGWIADELKNLGASKDYSAAECEAKLRTRFHGIRISRSSSSFSSSSPSSPSSAGGSA
ncbi:hypothetical protein DFH27DRAFT_557488 [Peziza echinospora]|nr:hypothetical protein DFH27DRAFT_557488 [Peziza echinospora]